MRSYFILLKHELRMLLINPATYIAAVLFLCLMGVIYWTILRGMVNAPEEELPAIQFFKSFWLPVFFVVPLLTMHSLAGERNAGTLDSLMTTPTSRSAIILSKFTGAYLFYMLLWCATLGFPFLTSTFFPNSVEREVLLDPAPIIGSLLFIATSGILFIAIGIFASSITRSQLVAGMLSFTSLFMVIVGGQLLFYFYGSGEQLADWLETILNYLQTFKHLDDFASGVVDTRPFFYYTSLGCLLLGLSTLVIEAKA
ncbi:ABC transporter permease [Coraliomargarita parva]|uniref:ABC transporter permease n=1 Tax=Coraliomargarita parva TaxID=3014050 RepID=UPI0022B3E598|nr:ABC transporter permease [Coraliomargarita parva]